MLRVSVLDFGGNWDRQVPLMKFTYNNSYQNSIGMAPFEALYGKDAEPPSVGRKLEKGSYWGMGKNKCTYICEVIILFYDSIFSLSYIFIFFYI